MNEDLVLVLAKKLAFEYEPEREWKTIPDWQQDWYLERVREIMALFQPGTSFTITTEG